MDSDEIAEAADEKWAGYLVLLSDETQKLNRPG